MSVASPPGWLARLFRFASLLCLSMAVLPEAVHARQASLEVLGQRIYAQGIGTDGKPIAAVDMSGQRVFAPQFHCVSCHRPSGYGSREGGIFIPPIAAPVLYQPLTPSRTRAFNSMYFQQQSTAADGRLYQGRTRPAYDKQSLAKLLREGIDPVGQPVPSAMPKFKLSNSDVSALDAYLRTLSARPDPGVDDNVIHFAIIVSDRISAQDRKTLVDTSQAFFTRYNSNVSSEQARPNFSPYYRSEFVSFWRKWVLDVWELKGPEASWPAQLEVYYSAQPAFAVIGGTTSGRWQPIGDFCNAKHMPCLFPQTDLPARDASDGGYTIYSYGGLPLEAQTLAAYLDRRGLGGRTIVQLAADDPQGRVPAETFAAAFKGSRPISETVSPDGWSDALARAGKSVGKDGVVVIWPGTATAQAVAAIATRPPPGEALILPSMAQTEAQRMLSSLPIADRLRLIHPRELPTVVNPHSYRVRAWLFARRVAVDPPEDQFQIYYALSVLEKAVMEIQGDFSREYLIEEIEMIAESNLNPGVYPTLSLGPGQRIASRGSYVVKLDPKAEGGVVADGDWIVP